MGGFNNPLNEQIPGGMGTPGAIDPSLMNPQIMALLQNMQQHGGGPSQMPMAPAPAAPQVPQASTQGPPGSQSASGMPAPQIPGYQQPGSRPFSIPTPNRQAPSVPGMAPIQMQTGLTKKQARVNDIIGAVQGFQGAMKQGDAAHQKELYDRGDAVLQMIQAAGQNPNPAEARLAQEKILNAPGNAEALRARGVSLTGATAQKPGILKKIGRAVSGTPDRSAQSAPLGPDALSGIPQVSPAEIQARETAARQGKTAAAMANATGDMVDQNGPQLARINAGLEAKPADESKAADAAASKMALLQKKIDDAEKAHPLKQAANGVTANGKPVFFSDDPENAGYFQKIGGKWVDVTEQTVEKAAKDTEDTTDTLSRKAWLDKHPGKTPDDYVQWKAGLGPNAAVQAQSGGITDDAVEMMADLYKKTGQLPYGAYKAGIAKTIINRAAQMGKDSGQPVDLATNQASFGADKGSLNSIQKQRDAVTAFENTANANLDLFLKQADAITKTGIPLVNQPLQWLQEHVTGSPEISAYMAARKAALNEVAKVISNPNLTGVLSDSARKEASDLIPPDATGAQIKAAAMILKKDMENRKVFYDKQIQEIKARIGQGGGSGGSSSFNVTDPTGKVHTFASQAQADAFKKLAGIK